LENIDEEMTLYQRMMSMVQRNELLRISPRVELFGEVGGCDTNRIISEEDPQEEEDILDSK
jgi:hypothetical protein